MHDRGDILEPIPAPDDSLSRLDISVIFHLFELLELDLVAARANGAVTDRAIRTSGTAGQCRVGHDLALFPTAQPIATQG